MRSSLLGWAATTAAASLVARPIRATMSGASVSRAAAYVESFAAGEWAGWLCEFNEAGALHPVPEHHLSQDAIDWGQIPEGFEVLTTEQLVGGALRRRKLLMLPADGCAVDDLTARVQDVALPLEELEATLQGDSAAGAHSIDSLGDPPSAVWALRTVFELDAPDAEQKQRWLKIISSKSEVPISGAEVAGAGSGGAIYQIQGYLLKLSGGSFGEGKKYQRRFFRLRNDDDAQVLQYFVSLRPIPKP